MEYKILKFFSFAISVICVCVLLLAQLTKSAYSAYEHGRYKRAATSRTFNGTFATNPSMTMIMEVSPYYNWNYILTSLLLSDTCAITRARSMVNTNVYPPKLITEKYRVLFIPRPGCDVQYHMDSVHLNNPPLDLPSRQHDIAMVKVRRKIKLGNSVCGGTPVTPAWFSCDEYGPPVNYTDCYFTSFGLSYALTPGNPLPLAPEDITTSQSKLRVNSLEECEHKRLEIEPFEDIVLHPKDQFCVSTPEDNSPSCDEDWNGAVFCKYWNRPYEEYYDPEEKRNEFEDYVAVGHRVHDLSFISDLFCTPHSAAYILKYGSQTYRQLFSTCGFTCSNTLPHGYKCKGNPPASLGPVYCIPEKEAAQPYPYQHAEQPQNYYY